MTDQIPAPDDSGKKKGRPEWFLKIDCIPEELAQTIFANADPRDPSLRKRNREDDTSGEPV